VLYRETFDTYGFDGFLREYGWMFDGVLLEWDEPDSRPYLGAASRHGVELVQCIGPWHTDDQIRSLMEVAEPNALVYLMSAQMTGAQLFPAADLTACIARAKSLRSDIKVAAGFGVRTAADVAYLHKVKDLDGVIIGTAFLEIAKQGVDPATRYVREISKAL
jgi:tryptophan synthase alpha subunit